MSALGGRLSSLTVKHARKPGMLADGNGLYLQVTRANARSWIFRYYRNGKSHEMGLGSFNAVGLADARLKASACRGLLANDIDPIAARNGARATLRAESRPPSVPIWDSNSYPQTYPQIRCGFWGMWANG